MRINAAAKALGAAVVVGFVATVGIANLALQNLKVGGPVYEKVILGKDLIADILPPPEYIIEAYLETTLAMNDPASAGERRKRLDHLRQEYDERHAYWLQQQLDSGIRDALTRDAHEPAAKFWSITGALHRTPCSLLWPRAT